MNFNFIKSLFRFSTVESGARFAIYSDSGVYGPSRRSLIQLLKKSGHTPVIITPQEIISGELRLENFDALVVPGGKSWIYLEQLGLKGAENIRTFVESGGGYLGFCAGAFMALSERKGGHTTGAYGIGLIEGTGIDAFRLGMQGFEDGVKPIRFYMEGFKETYQVSFLESPLLDISEASLEALKGCVVARYPDLQLPAAVYFESGQGKVFISGPHMELEEAKQNDPDSEWPMLELWVNAVVGGKIPVLTP